MLKSKRIIAFGCVMLMIFSFISNGLVAFAQGGDGNIDGGGSDLGGATSGNTNWSGAEGVRVTVVEKGTGIRLGKTIDITKDENAAKNIDYHFGKNNKLEYIKGMNISRIKSVVPNKYDYKPFPDLPKIINGDAKAVKKYFTNALIIKRIADQTGIDLDVLTNGKYKFMIEPILYVKYSDKQYALTATESSLFNMTLPKNTKGMSAYRYHLYNLVSGSLPLAIFLEERELGIPAYTGKQNNAVLSDKTIVQRMGVGIVSFIEDLNYDLEVVSTDVSNKKPKEQAKIKILTTVKNNSTKTQKDKVVEFMLSGKVLHSTKVTLNAKASKSLETEITIPNGIINRLVRTRINWADRKDETNADNNTKTLTINVTGEEKVEEKQGIIINKFDERGNTLRGVTFLVTGPNGYSYTGVTNKTGQIVLDDLDYGDYTIKEIATVPGYIMDKTVKSVTLNNSNVSWSCGGQPLNTGWVSRPYQYCNGADNSYHDTKSVRWEYYCMQDKKTVVTYRTVCSCRGYGESGSSAISKPPQCDHDNYPMSNSHLRSHSHTGSCGSPSDGYYTSHSHIATCKKLFNEVVVFTNTQIETSVEDIIVLDKAGNPITKLRRGKEYFLDVNFRNTVFEGKIKIKVWREDVILTDGTYDKKVIIGEKEINIPIGTSKTERFTFRVPNYADEDMSFFATINYEDKELEVDGENNEMDRFKSVYTGDLYGEFLNPNSPYREDTEVMATFMIYNDFEYIITPEDLLDLKFNAHYINKAGSEVNIHNSIQTKFVMPNEGSNIAYIKISIPENIISESKDDLIFIECEIDPSNTNYEDDETNNVTQGSWYIKTDKKGDTPDTKYEEKTPDSFTYPPVTEIDVSDYTDSKIIGTTWEEYVWVDGALDLIRYNVSLDVSYKLIADPKSISRKDLGSMWQIGSGYGYSLDANIRLFNYNGIMPKANMYTNLQSANTYLPEFMYSQEKDKYKSLENLGNNKFEFFKSPYTFDNKGVKDNKRIHFTPLWFPDSNYITTTYFYDMWTPVGMISCERNAGIVIKGTMYDDWYIGN